MWSEEFLTDLISGQKYKRAGDIKDSPEVTDVPWNSRRWKELYFDPECMADRTGLNILAAAYTERYMQISLHDRLRTFSSSGIDGSFDNIAPVNVGEMKTEKIYDASIPDEKPRFECTYVSVYEEDILTTLKKTREKFSDKIIALHNSCYENGIDSNWKEGFIGKDGSLLLRTTLGSSLNESIFPMEKYDVVYSRDVTVYRGPIDEGYQFLTPDEQWNFDVVTTLGYKPTGQKFTYKDALTMRAIMEKVFVTCLEQNVDILVLGAYGCGKNNCPSDKVAEVFRSVIARFAGFFSHIIFANVNSEDHPEVTEDFATALCGGLPGGPAHEYKDIASWSVKEYNFTKEICPSGGRCPLINDLEHSKTYAHPGHCPYGPNCPDTGVMHRILSAHDEQSWFVLRKGESISMRESAWRKHAYPSALRLTKGFTKISRTCSGHNLERVLKQREDAETMYVSTQVTPLDIDTVLDISDTERKMLTFWTAASKFKLLYRASRDGFSADKFHRRCDNRGSTLVIVQSTNDCVFGGYTSVPWARPECEGADYRTKGVDDEFVFSLRRPRGENPQENSLQRFDLSPGYLYSVSHKYGWGPIFGKSAIAVAGTTGDHSKCDPAGNFVIPKEFEFTEEKTFALKDYEVYWVLSGNEPQEDIDAFDEEFPDPIA